MSSGLTNAAVLNYVDDNELKLSLLRDRLKGDLKEFMKWVIANHKPGMNLRWNWHLDTILDHIQALYDGTILRLAIEIPPRHLKSTLVSEYFPIWLWLKDPSVSVLTNSYNTDLAKRYLDIAKDVISQPWFIEVFPNHIIPTSAEKTSLTIRGGGIRRAAGVEAGSTGWGGDWLISDDLLSGNDANSAQVKKRTLDWYRETLTSRANNPKTARWINIAQRLAKDDVLGYMHENDTACTFLTLPMEFDGVRRASILGEYDKREKIGELLHPGRISETELDHIKNNLGTFAYNAQYQQNPSTRGGNLFKREWFGTTEDDDWKHLRDKTIFVDSALKAGTHNDYTVCIVVAYDERGYLHILDMLRGKWLFEEGGLADKIYEFSLHHKERNGLRLRCTYVEDALSGTNLISFLKRRYLLNGLHIDGVKIPRTSAMRAVMKDKATRALDIVPIIEAGTLKLPKSAKWLEDFYTEFESFTLNDSHSHDDICDATFHALEFYLGKIQYARRSL